MQPLLDAIASLPAPAEAGRYFHGRGGRYPGCEAWTLDAYPPVWLVTSFAPATPEQLAAIDEALVQRWETIKGAGAGASESADAPTASVADVDTSASAAANAAGDLTWVFQQREESRPTNRVMRGAVPESHVVTEDGARYLVHLLQGQNHGFFLDMAEGRRWVRRWAQTHPGGKVLNLFAYTCAFSIAALQAGAREVYNYDMAPGALAIGRRNHALNGLGSGAHFFSHDVFTSWGKIRRQGPFDLVVLDPPSYQKGSFVATKDYARLARRLPELLAPGGHALVCLNTPKLDTAFLKDLMAAEAPSLAFVERVANPPAFADLSDERSLKVLVYRQPG